MNSLNTHLTPGSSLSLPKQLSSLRTKLSTLPLRFHSHLKTLWQDESGIGTIELVLILVVLIALVAIFKDNIQKLLKDIFDEINSAAADIY